MTAQEQTVASPEQTVERFLRHLCRNEIDPAADVLSSDVIYENVSLPTIQGRERVRRFVRLLDRPSASFELYLHSISSDGRTVMTERTDVLSFGRLRIQFWVCGRFDVADGEIVLWRDYFDWLNIAVAMVRGLVGVALPALRARPPAAESIGSN